jgi:hypothetical protein
LNPVTKSNQWSYDHITWGTHWNKMLDNGNKSLTRFFTVNDRRDLIETRIGYEIYNEPSELKQFTLQFIKSLKKIKR